jgi:hypothetical protein
MRGDSLRDLYAKTLALLGLGVLAGTGALVDYWPSGVVLPMVDAGLSPPEIARSLPVPDRQPNFIVRAAARRPSAVARPTIAVQAAPADRTVPVMAAASLDLPAPRIPDLALAPVEQGFTSIAMAAPPPATVSVRPIAFSLEYSRGEEVALSEPAEWPIATLAMTTPPVSLSSEQDDDGLFSGMVKRTGSSIVRGGRKTGASIVEAFRVVSGAVRRALPN